MAEPKGKIARWRGELEQFELEVNHRPVASVKDADALFRLAVVPGVSHQKQQNSPKYVKELKCGNPL